MVWETWIMGHIMVAVGGGTAQHFQLLRTVRLVRLLRVARSARLLHAIPELAVLGQGMIDGVRSLLAVFTMMMLIVYAFGVTFTVVIGNAEVGAGKFGNVTDA